MIDYFFNWIRTLNNITPVIANKIYNRNYDKSRPSYYNMSSIYSPISFFSYANYILDNIYLGSTYNASNWNLLVDNNIYNVINATNNIPNFFKDDGITYLNIIKNDDGEDTFTKEEFEKTYEFINNSNQNVLIHCVFGRSRSVTIILYYLIKKYNFTCKDALDLLKAKRYYINPSLKFIDNLEKIIKI
jgi:dual specificity phosphatase 12